MNWIMSSVEKFNFVEQKKKFWNNGYDDINHLFINYPVNLEVFERIKKDDNIWENLGVVSITFKKGSYEYDWNYQDIDTRDKDYEWITRSFLKRRTGEV